MLFINFSQLVRDMLVDWYESLLLGTDLQKHYIWNYKCFPFKSKNEPFATAAPHFFTALPISRPKVSTLPQLVMLCSHRFKMCNFHAHLFWVQCNCNPQDSQGMVRSSLLTLFWFDWKIRNKNKRILKTKQNKQTNKSCLSTLPFPLFFFFSCHVDKFKNLLCIYS